MTTPEPPSDSKTVRVRAETHRRIMALADRLEGSADDALSHLLGESTIRIQVSDSQRHRWSESAHAAGVSLQEFIKLRVEAAIQFGSDPDTLRLIYQEVRRIARVVDARSTRRQGDPRPSTPRIPPSTDPFQGPRTP